MRLGTAQQKLDVLKEELGKYSGEDMGKILAEINLLEFVIKSLLRPEPTEAAKDAKDSKDTKDPKDPKPKGGLANELRECNCYPFEYRRFILSCSRVVGLIKNSNCGTYIILKVGGNGS